MGEMSDKVIDAAKETASDALESGKQIAADAADSAKEQGQDSRPACRTAHRNRSQAPRPAEPAWLCRATPRPRHNQRCQIDKPLMRQELNVTKTGSPDEQENEPAEESLDNNRPDDHELARQQIEGPDAASFSPASQVGRSNTGGGAESVLDPDENVDEGWVAPDQTYIRHSGRSQPLIDPTATVGDLAQAWLAARAMIRPPRDADVGGCRLAQPRRGAP